MRIIIEKKNLFDANIVILNSGGFRFETEFDTDITLKDLQKLLQFLMQQNQRKIKQLLQIGVKEQVKKRLKRSQKQQVVGALKCTII